ncbi:hypothetical protein PDESU_02748 [Pontiella desulfatans]|uniref:Xylose isomerase-like TIM barrel domain-containing protein n=1 Tax=Pontiella desulfatans TaxID=2750659 RepID=A0A6C2U307_PONDE|nr:TIM barrel protein [Pontiella desulfatans]VGO14189.1 hypothetical protein PDESU_02748 [Pontiella desulfatans]
MDLKIFAPLWGSEQMDFATFADRVAEAGYDGVELSFPLHDEAVREKAVRILKERNLALIAQHWQTINPNIAEHIEEFLAHLNWLADTEPLFINSQTGRDWFSVADNLRIIEAAARFSEETGIRVLHETHRGKSLFCATRTMEILEAEASMRITADFSHWCTVSESWLEDQQATVAQAIARADHIHARVGHPEGPQVTDPRAPEWQDALHAHLAWWDAIAETKKASGERLTITSEFGPFPYMPTLPYTRQPIADQWEINVHMMNLLRQRYQ